ncbi:unnamed protein product [Lota lota]
MIWLPLVFGPKALDPHPALLRSHLDQGLGKPHDSQAADFHIHRPLLGWRPNAGAHDPHPNLTPSTRLLSALA